MDKAELEAAFLTTNYTILKSIIFKENLVLKIGEIADFSSTLTGLMDWAYITAWNPLPETLTDEQNVKRNSDFLSELKESGFVSHLGVGTAADGSWSEESFFIENMSKEKALFYAKKFGQLAFVHGVKNQKAELFFAKND